MKNIYIAANVVLPLIILMAIGALIRKTGLSDRATLRKIDSISFRVFMPSLLFYNIYKSNISADFNPILITFACTCIIIIFIFVMLIMPKIEHDGSKCASLRQAVLRSNMILFGVSVTESLYGSNNNGTVILLSTFAIPLMNILSVVILELNKNKTVNIKRLIISILKNPLIIASVTGVLMLVFKISLPVIIEKVVKDLSGVTTCLCFIVLGGSLTFDGLSSNKRSFLTGLIFRMMAIPLIFLTISILMGFRGKELTSLMVLFASPTAVSSFTMAQQMGADGQLAGQMVAGTTIFSILTIFILTFLFKTLGYI